jgi:hypothetical protein
VIVLPAPRVGLLAAVVLPATEGAAEILAFGIAWMRQKANAAAATDNRTTCQTGMIAQEGIERQLILTNKRVGAVGLMPIGTKREKFSDRYRKNIRFSVKILNEVCTPSSYSLDASASRCRARFFYDPQQRASTSARVKREFVNLCLAAHVCAQRNASLPPINSYLERRPSRHPVPRRSPPLIFQAVDPFTRARPDQKS